MYTPIPIFFLHDQIGFAVPIHLYTEENKKKMNFL